VFPLFATPHFYMVNDITWEYFVQWQESDDLALGNVNTDVKVYWCLEFNGRNVTVHIIRV